MIGFGGRLSPEVRALLDRERAIATQSPMVRARALARARAMSTSTSMPAVAAVFAGAPARRRWVAAAALVCILGAAVGAAAYEIRVRLSPLPSDRGAAPAMVGAPSPAAVALASPPIGNPVGDSPAPRGHGIAPRPKAETVREELRLLREARAAVARDDFAAALPRLAEHARRFKDGSLAEEREALRVKALAGLGRIDEARRAAATFGARFPRSVLLPAVTQMAQMATPRAPGPRDLGTP
jgi:hypothetical protein